MPRKRGDLGIRLLVAAVGIPFGIAVAWGGGWILAIVLGLLALEGTREVLGLARAGGIRGFPILALPAAFAIVAAAPFVGGAVDAWALPALLVFLIVGLGALGLAVFLRGSDGNPLAAAAVSLFAPLYVGTPLAFAWFLRHHPESAWATPGWAGMGFLLFVLIVTWFGDTTAYFGGHAMGRRKLLPSVSPAKTVEGALWGLVGSVVAALLVTGLLFPLLGGTEALSLPAAALLGVVLGAVGQVGDLAESVMKRSAGVKDSGALLPGHGGVLDRFDAVFFTLPLAWFLLPLFLGWGG